MPSVISGFVDQYTGSFKRAVGSLMTARTAALEEIKSKKEENAQIIERISRETSKKKAVGTELNLIDEMIEDLR